MVALKIKQALCLIHSGLLFASGLILIALAAFFSYKIFASFTYMPASYCGPFIALFILGFFHLLASWLGISGPEHEHDFHIISFVVVSVIFLASEFAIFVWCLVLWGRTKEECGHILKQKFNEMISENEISKAWISLQKKFSCCGLNGSTDYVYAGSCMNPEGPGCKDPYIKYVKNVLFDGAMFSLAFTLFQVIGIVIYIFYYKGLKKTRVERYNRSLALEQEQQRLNTADNNPSSATNRPESLVPKSAASP